MSVECSLSRYAWLQELPAPLQVTVIAMPPTQWPFTCVFDASTRPSVASLHVGHLISSSVLPLPSFMGGALWKELHSVL